MDQDVVLISTTEFEYFDEKALVESSYKLISSNKTNKKEKNYKDPNQYMANLEDINKMY